MGVADDVRAELNRAVANGLVSITGVAEQIGINRVSLSRFAHGHAGIAVDTLEKLVEVLNLKIEVKRKG